jgi:sulfoxide reductase heme-binding subunit YedZ
VAGPLMRLQSPLRGRRGQISPLKATTFALIVIVPTFAILLPWAMDSVGGDPSIPLTYMTGTWSCWFFLLSLTVTPVRRIFGWTQLIAIRRMLGVAAVVYTLVHIVVFFWLIRYDGAIFRMELTRPTIWVATASTLGFLMLAATSFDAAVAKMGLWWNRVHNATYVLTALALLHFLLSRASTSGLPFLIAGVFFWLMAWRVLDRFKKGTSVAWLLGLAVGVTAFNLGFEVVWLYFYRGRALWRTLTGEFTLQADFFTPVPATFELLIVGLATALLAATLGRSAVGRARRWPLLQLARGEKPLGAANA